MPEQVISVGLTSVSLVVSILIFNAGFLRVYENNS